MKVLSYKTGDNLDKIIEKMLEGKLIVYPTDTIYGIAANINIDQAIRQVYVTKQRPLSKPISVCFHDFEQLNSHVCLNSKLDAIVKKLLPGPYTLLLNKKDTVSSLLTANSPVIGVRIPDNHVSYELTKEFPITSTSANITNQKTHNNITQIKGQLGDSIDYYIDAGVMNNDKASTIIDLTKDKPYLIRKGVCDEKLLNNILKINLR